jgi:hypothetical protein
MRPSPTTWCALFVGVSSGCVDTSPVVVREDRDAAALVDAGAIAACRACIMGDGAPCRAAYDGCVAVPSCPEFLECAFELACFAPPAIEDRITCSQPCLTKYGIVSTSPAIAPIVQLNLCSQSGCREACVAP